MKKRSLVAAIAMLIVSAIVLTSSTYAWFASNGAATVGAMNANVANNDGTLQVMATTSAIANSQWKTALTSADYTGYTTALTPVSMAKNANDGPSFYKASYDGVTFTAGSNGTVSDYLKYGFDVKYDNASENAATVSMVPTWSDTSDFIYALVEVTAGGTTTYYMFSSGSYTPVTAITGEVTDTKGSGASVDVIDAADSGFANASMGSVAGVETGASGTAITFSAAASSSTTANVNIYIWAEGQDPQCSGITAAGAGSMSFNISVA